jgi:carbonic anhydrase
LTPALQIIFHHRMGKLNRDWVLCAEGNQQSPVDLTGAKQEKFDEMKLEVPTANLTIIH